MLGKWIKILVFIITILTIWLENIYSLPQAMDSSTVNFDAIMGDTYDTDLNEELSTAYEPDGISDNSSELMLFDFTNTKSIHHWHELSDANVWPTGMSKAVLVLHNTKQLQEAIFFTVLIPQPSGAAFAGQRIKVHLNLSSYSKIVINCRAQGQNLYYKMSFRHNGKNNALYASYDQFFKLSLGEYMEVELPLSKFEPYFRGRKDPTAEPLNPAQITSLELQMFAGIYETYKQLGTSSLEIKWIKAVAESSKNA